ncbi:DNA-binding PadR family transcriptional regulator [Anaerotaenia torta]|uniref:PadR family transcriptional regulator n=1 Tax=Anaerotaenia torta TaxID=433293 RepID=UPI003D1C9785
MANEKKLDCVILGLLSHEDLTGYEIKKRIDTALKFFWHASFGSIYPTLRELVASGFAAKSDTAGNDRNKIRYTITEQGRRYLEGWLELPAEKDELRYETLLKLFFADGSGKETALRHIENFEAKTKAELPYLTSAVKTLESIRGDDKAHLYYLLTAQFGAKVYQAYLDWCEEAKNLLKGEN